MKDSRGGGVGVCTVVGIVFIILKLVGVINWSWIWVLCPFWIPITLLILVVIFGLIGKLLDNIFHP